MTEDPKELVARLRAAADPRCYQVLRHLHTAAADLIDRLTADRERSGPEDVVERVARALAKHNYPGASGRDIDEMWDGWVEDARAAIAATPPRIPEGFVLVPVVPTEAMIDRFVSRALCVSVHGEGGWSNYAREQWATMIAAAPAPALPETGVE